MPPTAIIIASGPHHDGPPPRARMEDNPDDDAPMPMDETMLPEDVEIPDDAKKGDIITVGFRLDDPKRRTGTLCAADADANENPGSMDDLWKGREEDGGDDEEMD